MVERRADYTDFLCSISQTKLSINKYTPEGRKEVHQKLGMNTGVMMWLMKHPVPNETVEFNDNRISLFAGQGGKYAVTGTFLKRGDIVCRRKIPKWAGGTSEYSNPVLVSGAVENMLLGKDAEFAWEFSIAIFKNLNNRQKPQTNVSSRFEKHIRVLLR